MRKLTYKQGCKELEYAIEKYGYRTMRERKVKAVIDTILWGIAEGSDGSTAANVAITKYKLNQPGNGSHEWFDDKNYWSPVRHLDPDARVPDHDKIFPKR